MNLKSRLQSCKKSTQMTANDVKLAHFVIFSISVVIIYTIVVTILKVIFDTDFSSELASICQVFGGEILVCALIKIFKIRRD